MSVIAVGDKIPHFSLPDQYGGNVQPEDFRGKALVIFFYPRDFTPGCTKEACEFREQYRALQEAGAEVLGISADSPESHQKFSQRHNLPFKLLSDQGNAVRKLFGVRSKLFGIIPGRVTFIVDAAGVVRHIYDSLLNAANHAQEALKAVAELKSH